MKMAMSLLVLLLSASAFASAPEKRYTCMIYGPGETTPAEIHISSASFDKQGVYVATVNGVTLFINNQTTKVSPFGTVIVSVKGSPEIALSLVGSSFTLSSESNGQPYAVNCSQP